MSVFQGNDRSSESQQVQSLDKVFLFFFPYMGMTVILVKFQAYGCNGFHRIIGPVNAYPRPSCHFFPCLPMFPKSTFTYINHIPSSTLSVVCIYHFSVLRLQQFSKNNILKPDGLLGSIFFRLIKFQSYCPFPARLSLKMTF